jgi:hypothetical protein
VACAAGRELLIVMGYTSALPGEQPHAAVGAPGHYAEFVVLDLVNPAAPCGRLLGRAGKTGLDEGCRMGNARSRNMAVK